jgi:hypothetical protein
MIYLMRENPILSSFFFEFKNIAFKVFNNRTKFVNFPIFALLCFVLVTLEFFESGAQFSQFCLLLLNLGLHSLEMKKKLLLDLVYQVIIRYLQKCGSLFELRTFASVLRLYPVAEVTKAQKRLHGRNLWQCGPLFSRLGWPAKGSQLTTLCLITCL